MRETMLLALLTMSGCADEFYRASHKSDGRETEITMSRRKGTCITEKHERVEEPCESVSESGDVPVSR